MSQNMLKEEFSNGFGCDTLLACYQNGHLRLSFDNHIHKIITMLGGLKN